MGRWSHCAACFCRAVFVYPKAISLDTHPPSNPVSYYKLPTSPGSTEGAPDQETKSTMVLWFWSMIHIYKLAHQPKTRLGARQIAWIHSGPDHQLLSMVIHSHPEEVNLWISVGPPSQLVGQCVKQDPGLRWPVVWSSRSLPLFW